MGISAGGNDGGPLSEINVTPMVDVLLVLLIIFMITAPMLQNDIQIDLPQPNQKYKKPDNPPVPVNLRVHADGTMTWNNSPVDAIALKGQLIILGTKPEELQSELRIQAAPTSMYEVIAKVMAEAKNAGVKKIGFQK